MATTKKQSSRFNVSGALGTLRGHMGRGVGSTNNGYFSALPLPEAEQKALLRAVPDLVFRITQEQDGTVTVVGNGIRTLVMADGVADPGVRPVKKEEPRDLMESLCEELGRHAEEFRGGFLRTGEVQSLELHFDQDGLATCYEARAVLSETGVLLAVVRDITARRDAEDAIARSTDELTRLSEALDNEANLRVEEEKVIKNSFRKLENLLENTIEAIGLIVQKKDPQTARHQERVSKLACAIGREMGLEDSQVDVIGLAALLHDLGKVFISDSILAKPGKLSQAEYSAVKKHAEAEHQILKTIDLFYPIADIVHQHHERIDGSGYPLGLKGDEILMEARVIAVADVVVAMVSDRPHRRAVSVDATMKEIAAGKGRLYDPDVADACFRLFREGKFDID